MLESTLETRTELDTQILLLAIAGPEKCNTNKHEQKTNKQHSAPTKTFNNYKAENDYQKILMHDNLKEEKHEAEKHQHNCSKNIQCH